METDVASDLSGLSDELRILGEEINQKTRSVGDYDPERDQKKYNLRELHHQVLELCERYDNAYGAFIQDRNADEYQNRASEIRDGIEKVRSRLAIQAN